MGNEVTPGAGQTMGQPRVLWEGAVTPGGEKETPREGFVQLRERFWGAPCCPFCLSLQSYQQFSLTIAVVATMLLQKEPSMEAVLGLALRANLRQVRTHHLQELEDFINSYDSGTPSP